MTQFEIIILGIIYLICYGFTVACFIKEDKIWFRLLLAIVSLALAFYAPLMIGAMIYEKLKDNEQRK